MSTTMTTVVSKSNSLDQRDPMQDSGISNNSFSMRLSSSVSSGAMESSVPTVRMPDNTEIPVANGLQDSGTCSDLMMKLSLASNTSSPTGPHPNEAWREYYEPDEDGDVQLHLAVAEGLADVVEALIRLAPSTELLSIQNNQGYSPLHIAVLKNQPAFVRRLVVAGAILDLRDGEGNSPLHLTARRGYVECAEALLKPVAVHEVGGHGRRVPVNQQIDILDQRNTNGEHCVHLATMGGHMAYLQFLSWNNADINALEGRAGRSALHMAVGSKRLDLVQCLLEPKPRGCGANPDILDWYGRTPHQLSMINGNAEIAAYLRCRTPSSANWQSSWYEEPSEIDSEDEINLGPSLVNSSA